MHSLFTYIWVVYGVNVDRYTVRWVFGKDKIVCEGAGYHKIVLRHVLYCFYILSFFGSGVSVFKALQFQWNQNCRCERTRIRMLGTRQLRAQLAVGESVWQSVLLHRNLKIGGLKYSFAFDIQVYAYMVHIVNIRILYMGFLANRSHPYVLVLTDSTGILCRRNPLCFRVFHPVMQQILHLLRFIHQISISSLLFWSIWNSFRQCGRETVPRHPKGCQMDS